MPRSSLWLISAPGEILDSSWEISMYRLEWIGMVMRHGSGTVNQNSTKFLDFARSLGFRVAGSWFQHSQAHRWTWYVSAGGVEKEIDDVHADD